MHLSLSLAASGWLCTAVLAQTLPDYVQLLPLPVTNDAWVWAGSPPGDTSRLFVMEGGGTIRVLDITKQPGQLPSYSLRPTPFLIAASLQARSVAFAPDYATSGRFYVAAEMVTPEGTAIKEYTVSADPNVANATPVRVIKTFPGLVFDHAVGSINFGRDGMLYVGVGDGMNSNNAQAITTYLGKMLRIDVLSGQDDFPADAANNYHIPSGNPLISRTNAAPLEIWHIGIRNPWRWSFDRWSGDMWICDVGGNRAGEIDRLVGVGTAYSNLGWPVYDGSFYQGGTPNPDFTLAQLVPSLFSINREGGQCSTIGGVMYRGNDVRPWRGRFVWSDACGAEVYSAAFDGAALGPPQAHRDQLRNVNTGALVSFASISMVAEDGAGELYILQANRGVSSGGAIYRVVAGGPQPQIADVGQAGGLVGSDGVLDNNDFIAFITLFFNNDPRADMGAAGGLQGVDQRLDNNDFIAFIGEFFDGH